MKTKMMRATVPAMKTTTFQSEYLHYIFYLFNFRVSLSPTFFWVYSAVYFIHSAALIETLDALWQLMFLKDAGRAYVDKWHPYCRGWHDSASPKDSFHVKQILQYLNVSAVAIYQATSF